MRFLHAADLHLDTPVEGLRSYGREVNDALRDASLRAFDNLVRLALARQVSFCVFSGDIYDGAERGTRAQLRFRDGLGRLAAAGIRSFIVHGNHDPIDGQWTAIRHWPDGVTVFGPDVVESVGFEADGVAVTVHGISYGRRHEDQNLALRFPRSHGPGLQIGILHANVGRTSGHGDYSPCTLDDLRTAGIDYWALGHVHTRRTLSEGDPWVVYPGNLQGRHHGAAELGAKGAVLVEVTPAGTVAATSFVELDVIRFESVEVSIDDLEDIGQLQDRLSDVADDLRAAAGRCSVVVRATLVGRGPVHRDLARGTDGLHAELAPVTGTPFVWWDRFDDRTGAEVDLDAAALADDFLGNVLSRVANQDDEELIASLTDGAPSGLRSIPLPRPSDLRERARVTAYDALAGR